MALAKQIQPVNAKECYALWGMKKMADSELIDTPGYSDCLTLVMNLIARASRKGWCGDSVIRRKN
jgi:hypothetical protein